MVSIYLPLMMVIWTLQLVGIVVQIACLMRIQKLAAKMQKDRKMNNTFLVLSDVELKNKEDILDLKSHRN